MQNYNSLKRTLLQSYIRQQIEEIKKQGVQQEAPEVPAIEPAQNTTNTIKEVNPALQ
jgi:hypothetical protein